MSQRHSEYERMPLELYETPTWVTESLIRHLPPISLCWEPSAGSGKMARPLLTHCEDGLSTDIQTGQDFLASGLRTFKGEKPQAIITNPPFNLSKLFIEHSLSMDVPLVAMLLRADYDHAKTRKHLFADCPHFWKKIALTKRIVWFDRPGAAPSYNHAWFIWDKGYGGEPVLTWEPNE